MLTDKCKSCTKLMKVGMKIEAARRRPQPQWQPYTTHASALKSPCSMTHEILNWHFMKNRHHVN